VQALALAGTFRIRHLRAPEFFAKLPLPLRLSLSSRDGSAAISGARVVVDGAALPADARQCCRSAVDVTTIEISAEGYSAQRLQFPADADQAEKSLSIILVPAGAWTARLNEPGPWRRLLAHGDQAVLVAGERAVVTIALDSGRMVGALRRDGVVVPPGGGVRDPYLTNLSADDHGGYLLSTSDGVVASCAFDAARGITYVLSNHRGGAPVETAVLHDLVLQPGKHGVYTVETLSDGARLITRIDGVETSRSDPLRTALPPQLFISDARVIVSDDAALLVCEEGGAVAARHVYASARSGRVQHFAGGWLAIPTGDAVEVLRVDTAGAVQAVDAPGLRQRSNARLASDGADLFCADGSGDVRLMRRSGDELTAVWSGHLPFGRNAVASALAGDLAVVIDDTATIHCFSRADGTTRQRFAHAKPIRLAPIIAGNRVVVLDETGTLTAYMVR
jgi:hypothetical protein